MSHRYRLFQYIIEKQVILALLLVVGGWFIFQTRGIWVSFFLSYVITSALLPFVAWLRKHHFPKLLAVIIPYLTGLIIIVVLVSSILNTFIPEFERFIRNLPLILNDSARILNLPIDGRTLQSTLSSDINTVSQNAFNVTSSVFGGVFSVITILIVSFYLLLYHETFHSWLINLFETKHKKAVAQTLQEIDEKLGAWARGQLLLSVCIGLSIFLALTLLGLPYALPLGILAGLFEFIPTLGPTLAAIPAIIVALAISPSIALSVIALYIIIQFTENHVLVPNIMQQAVGINPVLVILGITIGANLVGIFGALLAVPFISFIAVLITGIRDVDTVSAR